MYFFYLQLVDIQELLWMKDEEGRERSFKCRSFVVD
jgi:hypothetical protein